MNKNSQFNEELKRKRELAYARLKRHRQKKREEAEKQNIVSQNEPDEQTQRDKLKRRRELARKYSKNYRDKKRLAILKTVEVTETRRTTIDESQIAGTSTNMNTPGVPNDNSRIVNDSEEVTQANQEVHLLPSDGDVHAPPEPVVKEEPACDESGMAIFTEYVSVKMEYDEDGAELPNFEEVLLPLPEDDSFHFETTQKQEPEDPNKIGTEFTVDNIKADDSVDIEDFKSIFLFDEGPTEEIGSGVTMESAKRRRASKTTREQYKMYCSAVEANVCLRAGKIGPADPADTVDKLWDDLATQLNSTELGPVKDVKGWKNVFSDWRSNIRKKARDLAAEVRCTDGQTSSRKPLTTLEERMLGLIGRSAIETELGPEKSQSHESTSWEEETTSSESPPLQQAPLFTGTSMPNACALKAVKKDGADKVKATPAWPLLPKHTRKRKPRVTPYVDRVVGAYTSAQEAKRTAMTSMATAVQSLAESVHELGKAYALQAEAKMARAKLKAAMARIEVERAKAKGIHMTDLL